MPTQQDVNTETEQSVEPSTEKLLVEVVADAYSFIRSMEANAAFATVTLDELIEAQIKRNGESSSSNAAQYNPYAYNTANPAPATERARQRIDLIAATDTNLPTKLDRVIALKNELSAVIAEVKKVEPTEVASYRKYLEALENTVVETETSIELTIGEVTVVPTIELTIGEVSVQPT